MANIIIKKLPSGGGGGSVDPATPTTAGVVKLYNDLGSNTDGTINQSFITEEINGINDTLDSLTPPLILDKDAEVTAETFQEINEAMNAGNQICIRGENGLVYLSTIYNENIADPETGEQTGNISYLIFTEGKELIYFLKVEADENNGFVSGAWFNSIEDVIPDIMYAETFSNALWSLDQVIESHVIYCNPDLVGSEMLALIVTLQTGQSAAHYFRYDENEGHDIYMDMSVRFDINYPILDAFIYLNEDGFSPELYSQIPLLATDSPDMDFKQYRFGSPEAYVPFKEVNQDSNQFIFEGTINNNLVTVDIEVDWENHSAQIKQTSTEIGGGNGYTIEPYYIQGE